jgi:hypothetical protein
LRNIFFTSVLALAFTFTVCAQNNGVTAPKEMNVKIKITVNDTAILTATMLGNATARDFISRLPLTAKLDDYSSTEKIFYPSPKLSTQDAPSGYDPSIGDICVYSPWGNICIFYRDFGYGAGLVPFGKIEGDMSAFAISGSLTATFDVIIKKPD